MVLVFLIFFYRYFTVCFHAFFPSLSFPLCILLFLPHCRWSLTKISSCSSLPDHRAIACDLFIYSQIWLTRVWRMSPRVGYLIFLIFFLFLGENFGSVVVGCGVAKKSAREIWPRERKRIQEKKEEKRKKKKRQEGKSEKE